MVASSSAVGRFHNAGHDLRASHFEQDLLPANARQVVFTGSARWAGSYEMEAEPFSLLGSESRPGPLGINWVRSESVAPALDAAPGRGREMCWATQGIAVAIAFEELAPRQGGLGLVGIEHD